MIFPWLMTGRDVDFYYLQIKSKNLFLVLSASSDTTVKVWDTQNGLYPHIDLIKYIYKDKEINKFFWRLCLRTACALSPRASALRYYC